MSSISALGYLGFKTRKMDQWHTFAEDVLGVSALKRDDDGLDLRIDDYAWRIRLQPTSERDDLAFLGWEVGSAGDLELLKITLDSADVAWQQGDEDLIKDRKVHDLIQFHDPDGTQCEAFYGPLQCTDQPFFSPKGVSFVTGDEGLGHIVLVTQNHKAMEQFYINLLGFKVSDYINTEVIPGRPLTITFLRCNGRHHSLALAPVGIPAKVAHIMLQTDSVDEVGRAMYRATDAGMHLSFTLGRHSNDEMLSFYVQSPSGFDVEYGWGALTVEDETWHVKTHNTNSSWGHTFQFPPRPPKKKPE
jgi:2,3-dihydroxybiphenyl 1,2-dioxygenase